MQIAIKASVNVIPVILLRRKKISVTIVHHQEYGIILIKNVKEKMMLITIVIRLASAVQAKLSL